MSDLTIRKLQFSDYDAWYPLWLANNEGACDDKVTAHTWRHITNKKYDVFGLCALKKTEAGSLDMVGILHYILHPVTGSIAPVCYMQDVFVDKNARRQGIAKALIEHLAAVGDKANWNRIYWLAEGKNTAAQSLYDDIGVKLDFSLHVWPLAILKN